MKWLAALTAAVLATALGASADMVSIPVVPYDTQPLDPQGQPDPDIDPMGQTSLFRADLSVTGIGSIRAVRITDNLSLRGSTGVFSGLDVDAVFFDADGDPTTTNDRILPHTGPDTYVDAGNVAIQNTSMYQPTAAHPGPLFGLNPDGTIDHDTATLSTIDTSFNQGVPQLTVDSSHGWVSVGDGGSLHATFPLFTLTEEQSMYLFVGDAGPPEEDLGATVEVEFFSEFALYFFGLTSGSIYVGEGDTINIDTSYLDETPNHATYYWDLDGDGEYDDAVGASPTFTFAYLHDVLGMPLGEHTVGLMIVHEGGEGEPGTVEYHETGVRLVPEPAALALLAVGAVGVVRRRRSRAGHGRRPERKPESRVDSLPDRG